MRDIAIALGIAAAENGKRLAALDRLGLAVASALEGRGSLAEEEAQFLSGAGEVVAGLGLVGPATDEALERFGRNYELGHIYGQTGELARLNVVELEP